MSIHAEFWMTCDGPKVPTEAGVCQRATPDGYKTTELLLKAAKRLGWVVKQSGNEARCYCPHCWAYIKSLKAEGGAK